MHPPGLTRLYPNPELQGVPSFPSLLLPVLRRCSELRVRRTCLQRIDLVPFTCFFLSLLRVCNVGIKRRVFVAGRGIIGARFGVLYSTGERCQ